MSNPLSAVNAYNRGLARGGAPPPPPALAKARGGRAPRYPRLGVYTGAGSSHSWLWFAESLERLGFYDLRFLDHAEIAAGGLDGLDGLAVSGGDTFAMARALGQPGAKALEGFLAGGGLYLGACAGAYLMLRSSQEPLCWFNFVQATIANLSRDLPQPLMLPEKYKTAYGCDYVFHPVREAVGLSCAPGPLGGEELAAPLYGGPAMIPASEEVEVLARYAAFEKRTKFLAPRDLAAETLLGLAAVLRAPYGRGSLYLFGPHFEHPGFPTANRLLAAAIYADLPERQPERGPEEQAALDGRPAKDWLLSIKRELSNSRIVALGLEDHPARWLIGTKVYEPAKLRVFLEALWDRLRALGKAPALRGPADALEGLPGSLARITVQARALKQGLDAGQDTQPLAEELFPGLVGAASQFMKIYFATALAGLDEDRDGRRLH
ncbi:MAG: hypothetical protein K9K66_12945 [Desulfarculaceae bacterium]|nr:hypothetical protein [Desulfarculaceae bacterium]MCF8072678.1 hypothetical protein [Desulfarculaceae bacterium]MCF8102557.1 hypothetical protein [Desulfarculaceae bacterium]MCF8116466.1 hypothetical protein [Desulfarculaceae bacterium]